MLLYGSHYLYNKCSNAKIPLNNNHTHLRGFNIDISHRKQSLYDFLLLLGDDVSQCGHDDGRVTRLVLFIEVADTRVQKEADNLEITVGNCVVDSCIAL